MKIMGIESSGLVASTAVVVDGQLVSEYTVHNKQTHSQTLLPMLRDAVERSGIALEEFDAIAVSVGPGSFTGLRIGSSTAKGLGLALGKPLVAVSSLEALAYGVFGTKGFICPIMDARRNQVYSAVYQYGGSSLEEVKEPQAVPIDELVDWLNAEGRDVILLGDGVPVFREAIEETLCVEHGYAPPHLSMQRAGAVAALGERYALEGRVEAAGEHKPVYLRLTQAERERLERMERERGGSC